MDIRGLGTRSLANLAYAYLVTGTVETAIADAEDAATKRNAQLDREARRDVVMQAIKDFDEDIARDQRWLPPGADPERLTRARSNVRALQAFMQDVERANEPDDD